MTGEFRDPDLDRRLIGWMRHGPSAAPPEVVNRALLETTTALQLPERERSSALRTSLFSAFTAGVVLAIGVAVVFALLNIDARSPTAAASPSPSASTLAPVGTAPNATATPSPGALLIQPELAFVRQTPRQTPQGTELEFEVAVINAGEFPAELFIVGDAQTECGGRTRRTRLVAFLRDVISGAVLANICRPRGSSDLASISFSVPSGQLVPTAVYLEVVDTLRAESIRSEVLSIPASQPPSSLPPSVFSPQPSVLAPTAPPGATPPATPSPTTGLPGWTGPALVSERLYFEPSFVVDVAGHVHAAATLDDSIWYVTNSGGRWTRERLSTNLSGGADREPSIAIDGDGSLWVAFTRFAAHTCTPGCAPTDSQGIFLVDNRFGGWSQPVGVSAGDDSAPHLEVASGVAHVATTRSGSTPLYLTNGTGTWTEHEVTERGSAQGLAVGADGLARMVIWGSDGLQYATAASATGGFVVEQAFADGYWSFLALDAGGEPHLLFQTAEQSAWYTRRAGGEWSSPQAVDFMGAMGSGIAVESDGTVHVVSRYTVGDTGLVYATNASGAFVSTQVFTAPTAMRPGSSSTAAVSTDTTGRAHMMFTVFYAADNAGLWYAIGP